MAGTVEFSEAEAWEHPQRFAAPHCRRCHGKGTVWSYMATDGQDFDQNALNPCTCVTRKNPCTCVTRKKRFRSAQTGQRP